MGLGLGCGAQAHGKRDYHAQHRGDPGGTLFMQAVLEPALFKRAMFKHSLQAF